MENKTLFYHGKTIDGHRFTIAGRFEPMPKDGIDQDIDVIQLGAALCSLEDQFVKKLGRKKAEGRMRSSSIKGHNYYSLYQTTRPQGWFEGKEIDTFIKVAKDHELIRSSEFKINFHL